MKAIDWLYTRPSCVTCQRAKAYREPAGIVAATTVNAAKDRIDAQAALRHLAGIDTLVVVRGRKVRTLDLTAADRPADDELLALVMGPTGNLRAPTARVGKTLVVGFTDDAYRQVFGS